MRARISHLAILKCALCHSNSEVRIRINSRCSSLEKLVRTFLIHSNPLISNFNHIVNLLYSGTRKTLKVTKMSGIYFSSSFMTLEESLFSGAFFDYHNSSVTSVTSQFKLHEDFDNAKSLSGRMKF